MNSFTLALRGKEGEGGRQGRIEREAWRVGEREVKEGWVGEKQEGRQEGEREGNKGRKRELCKGEKI